VNFLKLIRFPNLLIIVLTQMLVRWCLIQPMLAFRQLSPAFSDFQFSLLVLSTVLIAAAGYIINDYYDTDADQINKPEKVIIGKSIGKSTALFFYWSFNIIAVLAGFYLGFKMNMPNLVTIQLLSCGMLWFYSESYKKMLLVGNLVIAVLAALVPLLVGVYELIAERGTGAVLSPYFPYSTIPLFITGYALFAFLTTLTREIIKDIEDTEGDRADNCTTLPIVWGTNAAKFIIIFLCIVMISLLGYVEFNQVMTKDYISFSYFLILVQFPLLYLMYIVARAQTKTAYHFASSVTKFIMLTGTMSMLVFYLTVRV